VARRAAQDADSLAAEAERARSAAETLVNARRFRLATLESDAAALATATARQRERLAEIEQTMAALARLLEPAEQELASLEADQARVEGGEGQARAALHAAERANAEVQLDLARRREDIETMRRRIEDDFGLVELNYGDDVTGPTPLPLGELVARLQEVEELPEGLEQSIQRRRAQIRRMGAINPEAPAEYAEVQERHDFLTTQVADLEAAATQLRQVVAEMDLLMEREFRRTFELVAAEFRETFTRLFGGGTARLVLTDPDQLTTTGIDIVARLPGRRQQGLALLSGGERSLTASALVFALLRVSPTPFCVMDEVDAMLDEANVGRFRDLLSELSRQTQFVVITHNRGTVQAADTVYGISIGADSASQVVSLKLDGERVAA
jgi:chromosome segregation protein